MFRWLALWALLILAASASAPAQACPKCRPQVRAGIYNGAWAANALALSLPLVVIGTVALALHHAEPIAARFPFRKQS